MKFILPILFLLFAFACARPAVKIPNGAKEMDVITAYADSALYESMLTFLDEEKFVVDKADPKRRIIVTESKPNVRMGTQQVRLITHIKNGVINVRSEASMQRIGSRIDNVSLSNQGLAFNRVGFYMMDDIVRRLSRRLPGSTYKYVMVR